MSFQISLFSYFTAAKLAASLSHSINSSSISSRLEIRTWWVQRLGQGSVATIMRGESAFTVLPKGGHNIRGIALFPLHRYKRNTGKKTFLIKGNPTFSYLVLHVFNFVFHSFFQFFIQRQCIHMTIKKFKISPFKTVLLLFVPFSNFSSRIYRLLYKKFLFASTKRLDLFSSPLAKPFIIQHTMHLFLSGLGPNTTKSLLFLLNCQILSCFYDYIVGNAQCTNCGRYYLDTFVRLFHL